MERHWGGSDGKNRLVRTKGLGCEVRKDTAGGFSTPDTEMQVLHAVASEKPAGGDHSFLRRHRKLNPANCLGYSVWKRKAEG